MGTLTLSLSPSVDGNLIDTTSALATSSRPWTVTSTNPLVLTAGGATPSHTGGWAMSTTEDQVYVVEFEVADESGITGGAYMQVSSDPANDLGANPRFFYGAIPGFGFNDGNGERVIFTGTGGTMYVGPALQIDQGGFIQFNFIRVSELNAPSPFSSGDWSISDLETGGDARITVTSVPAGTDLINVYVGGVLTITDAPPGGIFDVIGAFSDGFATNVYLTAENEAGRKSDPSDTKSVTTTLNASVPGTMAAPTATADEDLVTVTLAAFPNDDGGSPVLRRDIEWSTDEATWTRIQNTDPVRVIDTNLFETDIYVRNLAVNAVGDGTPSPSFFLTTGAESDPPAPGTLTQMSFADPDAPTRAEVEQIARERWHTRPDWWVAGTTPKVIGTDSLPAQFSYDAGSNTISVASNGGTLDGWDFAQTHTRINLVSGDDVTAITNCKFAPEPTTKAQRIASPSIEQVLDFGLNQTGRVRHLSRCWFTTHPDHDGGAWGPNSLIYSQASGTAFPTVDVFDFCSFEGQSDDSIKLGAHGIRRGLYFDATWNTPDDAELWDSGATYNKGDVVFNSPQGYLRLCLNDGVTSAPNFSSKLASTSDWRALDPHGDTDQSPGTGDIEYAGCFFNRDQNHRRLPSRQVQRGLVNALRYNSWTGSSYGDVHVHHNIFAPHKEFASNLSDRSPTVFGGPFRSGKSALLEENWNAYGVGASTKSNLVEAAQSYITLANNTPNWDWWDPATLSGLSASYSGGALTYGFTASLGGWAIVVVTASGSSMTAKEIIDAHREGTALASFEIDAPTNTAMSKAHTVALSAGTYYAHMLYQAGGGVDTLAAVQTVVVA
jgi:hypothetical protein